MLFGSFSLPYNRRLVECVDSKTKEITKKESNLSWLLLFLLQCTVDIIDCFYKLSLAIPYINLSDFFIQADRLGISSRVSVYLINNGKAVIVYHHTAGVYFCRLDDIQLLAKLMICNSFGIDDIQGSALIFAKLNIVIFILRDIIII